MPGLRVIELAGTALVEDAGRSLVTAGVPRSGAFDPRAHAAGAALVSGNPTQAGLEILGRIVLRADQAMTCAVTGHATVGLDSRPMPTWTALDVPEGAHLEITSTVGRAYLSVAGGLPVPAMLGSRSTCLLGSIGPDPVRVRDRLPLSLMATARTGGAFCRPPQRPATLGVIPGPHLSMPATEVLVRDGSRIGVRVQPGRALAGVAGLPSLGVVPGAIQVLPSGEWVILGPDAGTMGGYPIAGVLSRDHLGDLAHMLPGDRVHLVPIPADPERPRWQPHIVWIGDFAGQ